ncbi:Seipin family [Dillenia turbinata]|uniref:Seipin family n=1 Tax=Dillenia turbinata TaxID=194707 RepID=A0AAN8U7M4_9MAGN
MSSESFYMAEDSKPRIESAIQMAPSGLTRGGTVLLKRLPIGLLGAACVGMVLLMLIVVAALVGFCLVQIWVEEPVFVRERLYFDYTDAHPKAVLSFGGFNGFLEKGVPVGQTFHVFLVLFLPESKYNRELGMFQLTAELVAQNGKVIAQSSRPCMIRYRSLPLRLMHTVAMSVPLILGISSETQKIFVDIIRHKERHPRTEAIIIKMIPRAGTSSLPQVYEAEIVMNSQLPWRKQVLRSWRWTFYVWTSLNIYMILLATLVCCFKPLFFPTMVTVSGFRNLLDQRGRAVAKEEAPKESQAKSWESIENSEAFRRWQRRRRNRKEALGHRALSEGADSSASSTTTKRADSSTAAEYLDDCSTTTRADTSTAAEYLDNSESVNFGGWVGQDG